MITAELDQLRALARAATPGPWRVEAQGHAEQDVARVNNLEVAPPDSVELAHCADDAAYIAAVSPDVVLGLIDEVLTSRRRIGALTTLTDAQTARLQSYMNDGAKRAEAINTLASEREANALLTDEIEQLRADAERYRWLRGGPDVPSYSSRWPRWEVRYWDGRYWQTMFAEHLDEMIDAAMKEQKE